MHMLYSELTTVARNHRTIVGTWDLTRPADTETIITRVRIAGSKSLETLGPEGDRRTKVPQPASPKEYQGKYLSSILCKFFGCLLSPRLEASILERRLTSFNSGLQAIHVLHSWRKR